MGGKGDATSHKSSGSDRDGGWSQKWRGTDKCAGMKRNG